MGNNENCAGLSKEEEKRLIRQIENGDLIARNKLVMANLNFAYYMAERNRSCGLEMEDLKQECIVGLIDAANRVKSNYNNKFTTYAAQRINYAIDVACQNAFNGIHYSDDGLSKMKKVRYLFNKYREENNITVNEAIKIIAKKTHLPDKKILQILVRSESWSSLDEQFSTVDDENCTLMDMTYDKKTKTPEQNCISKIMELNLKKKIRKLLLKLDKPTKRIVDQYYGFNGLPVQSLEKIGRNIDMTKSGVKYHKNIALKVLKAHKAELKEYIS